MKVSGAFFYENIWRNQKVMQKISAPQSVNCCVTGFRRTLIRLQNRK
mgnify:CR=1 FL=1